MIFRGRQEQDILGQNLPTSNIVRTPTNTYLPVGVGPVLNENPCSFHIPNVRQILLEHFIKHKSLISEECSVRRIHSRLKNFFFKEVANDYHSRGRGRSWTFFARTYLPQPLSEHLPTPTYRQEQVRSLLVGQILNCNKTLELNFSQ